MASYPESYETERRSGLLAVISFLVILAILVASAGVVAVLHFTAPKAEKKKDGRVIPVVEVHEIRTSSHVIHIGTQGVVESRRETRISPEVTGRVLEISPNLKQGGLVRKGELMARIEDVDYRAAQARANAALADAELALASEEARASQALIDWQRLGRGGKGNPLVLREPQLAAARAKVESAREEAARAGRDLERTRITAPFDAAIRMVDVEVGSIARPGQTIAEIYSCEDLQIRLPLPLEDLGFIGRDKDGRPSGEITLTGTIGGKESQWAAESIKLDPEIDRRTLSGHWIVRVLPNKGSGNALPPVGLFVRADIKGDELKDVVEVPRRAIREGGEVLVVTPENRLEFRKLEVVRRTRDSAIVSGGLRSGDRICLTRLNAPIAGMEVSPGKPGGD